MADLNELRLARLAKSQQQYRAMRDGFPYPQIEASNRSFYEQGKDPREEKWAWLVKTGLHLPDAEHSLPEDHVYKPLESAPARLGSALTTGASWMGLPISAVTNGVTRNLANAADYATSTALGSESRMPYPDATTNAIRDINTFSFNLPEHLIGRALPSHDVTKPMDLQDTYETLRDYNVPDYAAIPLGGMTDAALDAWNPGGFLRARALPLSKGLQHMATDFGPEIGVQVLGGLVDDTDSSWY